MEGVCSIRVIDIDNSRLRSDVCHGRISSILPMTMCVRNILDYHWIPSVIDTELVSMSYCANDISIPYWDTAAVRTSVMVPSPYANHVRLSNLIRGHMYRNLSDRPCFQSNGGISFLPHLVQHDYHTSSSVRYHWWISGELESGSPVLRCNRKYDTYRNLLLPFHGNLRPSFMIYMSFTYVRFWVRDRI
jgi:hypothetical protein